MYRTHTYTPRFARDAATKQYVDDSIAKIGDNGGGGIEEAPIDGEQYVRSDGAWEVVEPGPQGEIGPQGPIGPQGVKGDTGDTGPQGIQGIQGVKGDKGDKGDTGATGAMGAQGTQGPIGNTGATGAQGIQGNPGQGVAAGGTAGQVLSKIDATNYNTQWTTPSAGGSSITIADNAPAGIHGNMWWESDTGILWIYYNDGTSSQWVQVNSGASVVVAGGVHTVPYLAEPEMYITQLSISSTAGLSVQTCAANQIWFVPLIVPWGRTMTSIAFSIPTGGNVAGSNARLALYDVDLATGRPGNVLIDAGSIATATIGLKAITINQFISPGAYYAAIWTSHAIQLRTIAVAYCPAIVGFRLGNASPHAVASLTRNATFGGAFANEAAQVHTLPVGGMAPLIGIR